MLVMLTHGFQPEYTRTSGLRRSDFHAKVYLVIESKKKKNALNIFLPPYNEILYGRCAHRTVGASGSDVFIQRSQAQPRLTAKTEP